MLNEDSIKRFLGWNSEETGSFAVFRRTLKELALKSDVSNRMRYDPVLQHISTNNLSDRPILEIGSGSVGMSRYFKRSFVGADLDFYGPGLPQLKKVKSDATSLPFADNQFELVLSVDMLEHVQPQLRPAVIKEMLRVSSRWAILGMPCGVLAEHWESKARRYWKRKIDQQKDSRKKEKLLYRGTFLNEHKDAGLPTEEEIMRSIEGAHPRRLEVRTHHSQSVVVWLTLALANLRFSYLVWSVSLLLSNLFLPVLRRVTWVGPYRAFFIVKKD